MVRAAPGSLPLLLGACLIAGGSAAPWGAQAEDPSTAPAATSAGSALSLSPLWGGEALPGRTTELRVRLVSHLGGQARLSARAGGLALTLVLDLRAGEAAWSSVPVLAGADGRVELEAQLPDGPTLYALETLRRTRDGLALRVATHGAPNARVQGWAVVDPVDLPRRAEGYGPVGLLDLAARDLGALDPDQALALARYLDACGTLRVADLAPADLGRIRSQSGCGGRQVLGPEDAVPADPAPPWPGELARRLLAADPAPGLSPAAQAGLLLLPYGLLLAALLLLPRPGTWVLALPLGYALLLWQALPKAVAPALGLAWAELEPGAERARIAASVRLQGDGHGGRDLDLGPDIDLPIPLDGGRVRLDAAGGGARIEPPTGLLQVRRYLLGGSVLPPPGIEVESGPGGWRLINRGEGPVEGAWLAAPGGPFPLPSLPPGETHWTEAQGTQAEPPAKPPSDLPPVLRPALVLPWPPGEGPIPGLGPGIRAWIALYPGSRP